ncbi:matrixin family metalloprotease, partial [Desmonostoc muscorum CCALA 125]|nr:matrixin family metalloprotease [Desmonostoc muscorum CCALA 125]
MVSPIKLKLGLDIEPTLKYEADSDILLPHNGTIEPRLEDYGDRDILLPLNISTSDKFLNSSNYFTVSDSSNASLKLSNFRTQKLTKTESKTFANPTTTEAKSVDEFQESLNLFPSKSPDAIYAPGAKITEPESFLSSGSKWAQPGGKNTTVTITYSYSNLLNGKLSGGLSNSQITGIIREAVGLWSIYAPLNFVEVADSGPAPSDSSYAAGSYPQIRFGTHYIDGSNNVLAHGYYPSSTTEGLAGDIHFDSSETWKASPSGGFDLLEVAVHELGHALGLNHEPTQTAIMNPYYGGRYSGLGTAFLFQDDINGIRDIYGIRDLLSIRRWATRQGGFWDAQQWL